MRRLLRWLVNGLCLLSLLATVGTRWLWWRAGRPYGWCCPFLEVAALGADLEATSTRTQLAVRVTGGWPGPAGAWAGAGLEDRSHWLTKDPQAPTREWRTGWGLRVERGRSSVYLDAAGTPARLSEAEWLRTVYDGYPHGPDLPLSGPLPYAEAGAPAWAAVALFSLPPLLWLATRTRRLYAGRRRSRLGLCPRCGYDFTGNTSGRCSECGTAVEAGRRVTV